MFANVFQFEAKCVGILRVRLEQIIAHVGAGDVDVGANIVERLILGSVAPLDLIVTATELLQDSLRVDSGESHDRQEAAKAQNQGEA
jgi:hypothetical protein